MPHSNVWNRALRTSIQASARRVKCLTSATAGTCKARVGVAHKYSLNVIRNRYKFFGGLMTSRTIERANRVEKLDIVPGQLLTAVRWRLRWQWRVGCTPRVGVDGPYRGPSHRHPLVMPKETHARRAVPRDRPETAQR